MAEIHEGYEQIRMGDIRWAVWLGGLLAGRWGDAGECRETQIYWLIEKELEENGYGAGGSQMGSRIIG